MIVSEALDNLKRKVTKKPADGINEREKAVKVLKDISSLEVEFGQPKNIQKYFEEVLKYHSKIPKDLAVKLLNAVKVCMEMLTLCYQTSRLSDINRKYSLILQHLDKYARVIEDDPHIGLYIRKLNLEMIENQYLNKKELSELRESCMRIIERIYNIVL